MWPWPARLSTLTLLLVVGATTAPTTFPATAPTTEAVALDPAIRRVFVRLADTDPVVRDAARESLMGLPSDALPKLLAIVRDADPLLPAQAAVLQEVVSHVYLTGERYAPMTDVDDPNRQQLRHVIGLRGPDLSFGGGLGVPLGIPVVDRWPGFPARRVLRDGDLILGIYIEKQQPLEQLPNRPTHMISILQEAIRDHPDVLDIDLSILRDGRVIRVSMTLVPQAADTLRAAIQPGDTFLDGRQQRATKYWDDNFAALVDPVLDPPAEVVGPPPS